MYPDPSDPSKSEPDVETILWASDVLIDRNYLAEHLSYPLGADAPSSAIVKRILNAAWSSITSGLTPELLKTFLAAMMNVPVIQREKETVVNIETTEDAQVVHTDAGTYYVSLKARLIDGLHTGSVLHKGDLLDESLRVYSSLNSELLPQYSRKYSLLDYIVKLGMPCRDTSQPYTMMSMGIDVAKLGFRDGDLLQALTITASQGVVACKVYARIRDSSDNHLIAVSLPANYASGSKVDFVFNDGVRLSSSFILDFAASSKGNSISLKLKAFEYNVLDAWKLEPYMVATWIKEKTQSHLSSLIENIPSVTLPSALIRPPTQYGIYAMWGEVEVKRSVASPSDVNGNPHLYFDVGGTKEDVDAFWRDVWTHAEQRKVSMEELIGPEGTHISPARFFMKHFVGANTIFVVVDEAQIDDLSLLRDQMFFGMLYSVVPSAVRLFVVEHKAVGSDDEMSLDGAKESTFIAVALPQVTEHGLVNTVPGMAVPGMSLEDRVSMRFVRIAPTKIRVRKEEV
jgi:hypothetical protein